MNARWLWIAVLACAAVVQWALAPNARRDLGALAQPEFYGPAQEIRNRVAGEALATARQIQGLRQVERYSGEAVEGWQAGAILDSRIVIDRGQEEVPVDDAVLDRARTRLDGWELQRPRVAVGFYEPGVGDWPAGLERPYSPGGARVASGVSDGGPWCIQLGRLLEASMWSRGVGWTMDESDTGPGSFGACWLHARYGPPGPDVAEWMSRTGFEAALASVDEPYWNLAELRARRMREAVGLRNTMGIAGDRVAALGDRCIAADDAACVEVFLSPVSQGETSEELALDAVLPGSAVLRYPETNYLPPSFLHDLEVRYGPERMADFWTSDEDVVTAYEAAFGVPVAEAMRALGRERFGLSPTGPGVPGWGWAGLIGALVLGLGIGLATWARRAVA